MSKNFRHDTIFPNPLLCCILGPTYSGKTYLLFNILTHNKLVDFEELVIYCPESSQKQLEYQFLKHGLENGIPPTRINSLYHVYKKNEGCNVSIEKLFKCAKEQMHTSDLRVPIEVILTHKPDENIFNNNKKTCVVFDDVICDKNQSFQEKLFTAGRHGGCCAFYIAQNFAALEGRTIRQNATCYIVFNQRERDLNFLCKELILKSDSRYLKQKCKEVWSKEFGYVYINTRAKSKDEEIFINIF